jgi:transcriptional regulator with XRE-family HTH domain
MSMPSRRCPDPFATQIGERIRQLRKKKDMSLVELSRVSKISRGHLSDIERGKVVMTIGTLGSVAGALRVPPFIICLVPKDDVEVAVIDEALAAVGGDFQKVAEQICAVMPTPEQQASRNPNE